MTSKGRDAASKKSSKGAFAGFAPVGWRGGRWHITYSTVVEEHRGRTPMPARATAAVHHNRCDSESKFVSTRYPRMRSSPGTQGPRLRSEWPREWRLARST